MRPKTRPQRFVPLTGGTGTLEDLFPLSLDVDCLNVSKGSIVLDRSPAAISGMLPAMSRT